MGDGRFRRADRVGPGLGEQGGVLVDLFGLATILLILSGFAIRALAWVRDLIETVVDDFALRKVGEEAPSDNLGSIGARLVDALVRGGCAVVPLEGPEAACGGGQQASKLCMWLGENLQQSIDNGRVAASAAKVVHQAMQALASRSGP